MSPDVGCSARHKMRESLPCWACSRMSNSDEIVWLSTLTCRWNTLTRQSPGILWFDLNHGFFPAFGDISLWNIWCSGVVLPYVSLDMTQRPACLEEDPAFITRPPSDVLARLLPDAPLLHIETCEVDETAVQITLRVQSTQISAPWPLCATPARRRHSDYGRTLADLPWAQ
jgi:hypothetical protein